MLIIKIVLLILTGAYHHVYLLPISFYNLRPGTYVLPLLQIDFNTSKYRNVQLNSRLL